MQAPRDGAETWFASGTAAFAALPPPEQRELQRWAAVHDYNTLNELLREENPGRPSLSAEARAANPPVLRPLVAQHPHGEPALYVPQCHIASVVKMPPEGARGASGTEGEEGTEGEQGEEGMELLRRLVAHTTSPEFVYEHHWRPGDCIVWDNRNTLHAPSAFGKWGILSF